MRKLILLVLFAAFATLAAQGGALIGLPAVLTAVPSSIAAGPIDPYNAGPQTATISDLDTRPLLGDTTYQATTFPLKVTFRTTDSLWEGVQARSVGFGFIQLLHKRVGSIPNWGRGVITLETSMGQTASVATVVGRLHSTPLTQAGPISPTRVAGFSGLTFDTTITGHKPGETGIPFIPFTRNTRPGGDHKYAEQGYLLRIIVIAAHGKTLVIYLDGACGGCVPAPTRPKQQYLQEFMRFAAPMLATVRFAG